GNACRGQMRAETMTVANNPLVPGDQLIKYGPRLFIATHESEDPATHILRPTGRTIDRHQCLSVPCLDLVQVGDNMIVVGESGLQVTDKHVGMETHYR